MRRRITGPLLISVLMHLALGIVLLVGVNIEPPKRPAGTPGAIVHAVVIDRLEFNQHAQFVRKQQQQQKQQEEERVQQQKAEAEAARQQKQEEVVRLRKAEAERKAAKETERKQEVERQRKEAEKKLALQQKKKEEELKQKQVREQKLAEERKRQEAEKQKKQEAEKQAEEQKKLLAEKKAEALRKKQEAEKQAEEQKKLLAEKQAEELRKKKDAEKKAEQERKQKLKEKQDAKRLEDELFSDLDTPNANDSQNNPSASGSPGETDAYQGLIVATIQRYWLVDQTMFGKECQLKVQLAPDGLVVSVGGGQGDSAVCRASIAAINKIEKFPAPPKGIYESAKNLSLTLQPGSR